MVEADESDGTFLELPRRSRGRHQRRGRPPRPLRRLRRRCEARSTASSPRPAGRRWSASTTPRAPRWPLGPPRTARHLRHADRRRLPHGRTSSGDRDGASFTLVAHDGDATWAESTLPVPGCHNARNAAAAAVTGPRARCAVRGRRPALARFGGVARRFEFRGEAGGITFVDDYAHLPTEVAAALARGPGRRLGPGRRASSSPTATAAPRRCGPRFADAFVERRRRWS